MELPRPSPHRSRRHGPLSLPKTRSPHPLPQPTKLSILKEDIPPDSTTDTNTYDNLTSVLNIVPPPRNRPFSIQKTLPPSQKRPFSIQKTLPLSRNRPFSIQKILPPSQKLPFSIQKTLRKSDRFRKNPPAIAKATVFDSKNPPAIAKATVFDSKNPPAIAKATVFDSKNPPAIAKATVFDSMPRLHKPPSFTQNSQTPPLQPLSFFLQDHEDKKRCARSPSHSKGRHP